ncbi:restriction endonuclease subunit S [Peloplasma aerotolerans]|uniref:Restriction endonuclease subunit S n=1 Tax=Peloplasma aerotolerans TaxID=3044389 RepID=A0AAW6U8V7_9MOLU|nr:restriction endonuclease subunit S [Mariniplasma sp. M4Ah]MDI6452124.1 restriction endonuclease subunit S [Mariniplasma sp. M4Ah]
MNYYTLNELISISNEKYNPLKENLDYKCIELEHIEQETGKIIGYTESKNLKSIKNKFKVNDVLFGKLRPYLRKYAYPSFEGVCSSEIWVLKANKRIIDNHYLFYLVQTSRFIRFSNLSTGSKMPRADWTLLRDIEFKVPFLEEQKKIANILATWDRAIDLNNDYILNTKKIYQIVSRLIYVNCYLKSDTNYRYQIKDILKEEVLKTTKNSEYDVLSSTKENVVKQSDYFNRQIASANNIGYKILKKDRIVMSPQNAWMGNINYNSDFEIGIVSPSYKVFVINGCELNYVKHLIKTERFINLIDSMSIQGASVVRKNLSIDDFLEAEIYLPSVYYQKKHGKVLDAIKDKIKLLETKQYYLNNQKKGLMQQLLTGKIRVQS